MAIRKSEHYSLLGSGCDEFRDGMDVIRCKDYVLVMKVLNDQQG